MDSGVIWGAVFLFAFGVVLIILGISFIADIRRAKGPAFEAATVETPVPPGQSRRRTYTFLRIESEGVAWAITILTFVLAAGAIVGGIVLLAMG